MYYFPNLETPFPTNLLSSSKCCFLTCIQFPQEAGKVVFPSLEEFSTICCDPHSQRLQQYFFKVNQELPDVQDGFRKGRGTRDQIASIHWIIGKARELQKNIYFCFIDFTKAFDCVDHNRWWKVLPATCETCMQVKKQQLEPDMEQQTGSKLLKEYVKNVYCHPAYLTYMQSTSCEMLG